MSLTYYQSLFMAYGAALGAWLLVARHSEHLRVESGFRFERPAVEFGLAVAAALAVPVIGQLYVRGYLIPAVEPVSLLTEVLNQGIIFSPILLLLAVRRQPLETAWLPGSRVPVRIGLGLGLSLLAVAVFLTVLEGARPIPAVLIDVYAPANLPHLAQVLLEDVSIAVLFFRLSAWIGARWSTAIVAVLFAAAHIPAMLSGGAAVSDLWTLILDTGLAVAVLAVLQRAQDIWWFWWVHFAMDMMQYYAMPQ